MKKFLLSVCTLALSSAVLASGGSVVANGGFRDPAQGVATFAVSIQQDSLESAFFVFASEGNHQGPEYPDAVFKSVRVIEYFDMGNTVMITGSGLLYNQIPVSYMAMFRDAGDHRGDHMQLHCWVERSNHIVHFMEFITAGDIVVTPGK